MLETRAQFNDALRQAESLFITQAKPAEHLFEKHLRRPRALLAEQAKRLLALWRRESASPLGETRQGFGTGNDEIHRQTGTKDLHQIIQAAAQIVSLLGQARIGVAQQALAVDHQQYTVEGFAAPRT